MSKLTIYEAEYWTNRYLETYSNDRARKRLAAEVGAEWGDSVLAKTMEHWKKLADQPTRPVGASPEDQLASKANGEGSIPSAPAIDRMNALAPTIARMNANWQPTRLERQVLALLSWRGEIASVSVHYKGGAVATVDGVYHTYMPANYKPRIVRVESTHEAHQTAASFDACPECNPKQKMDHLPEGSY